MEKIITFAPCTTRFRDFLPCTKSKIQQVQQVDLQVKILYNKSPPEKVKLNLLETCYSRYLLYLLYVL